MVPYQNVPKFKPLDRIYVSPFKSIYYATLPPIIKPATSLPSAISSIDSG